METDASSSPTDWFELTIVSALFAFIVGCSLYNLIQILSTWQGWILLGVLYWLDRRSVRRAK